MNILIAGVGGQGTLLASKMLGMVAQKQGLDVKLSEVHGMSQRGGSVVTCVKIAEKGKKVFSPIIDMGEADIIMAFEQLEALRWLPYLKKDGTLIVNTQKINPMPVISGTKTYPGEIIKSIKNSGVRVYDIDALEIAKECGTTKAVNIVLIGVLSQIVKDIDKEIWLDALRTVIPTRLLAINEKAFQKGAEYEESDK
ncbi:MAG TPA: indolepyruvate oxidoreductase subunit beta [Clostridiaceae bacterium]|jgi:indolepyruvate ferredoxin oxidoreductase beta subunit|nr:indolepyruvate oxidoreductase subunit beta [Clostridiaceae bacterium]